jgi:hypothetical protein
MLRAYPKVRVSGVLAKQFGKNEVPLTRILRVVRIQPAGPLRTEAMTRFPGIVEGDRNLRRGLRDMTSPQLLLFLRKQGGRNAGDLARFLAAEANDANVRQRALRAVRSLPKRG